MFTLKGFSIGFYLESPFPQDQEVRNRFKISQNPVNTSLKIKVVGEKGEKKRKKEENIHMKLKIKCLGA